MACWDWGSDTPDPSSDLIGMEKTVAGSLDRLEALASAPRPLGSIPFAGSGGGYSETFGGVTVNVRLNIAKVATAEFALTSRRADGRTLRVSYEFPILSDRFNGFKPKSACPTADGKVNATDGIGITVRTELRSNGGKTLDAYYLFKVVNETEMQGIVGDDAKLDTLEIRSIEEVNETAYGSEWAASHTHAAIVRNTVVNMRNGNYTPTVTPVTIGVTLRGLLVLFGSEIRQEIAQKLLKASKDGFAATVNLAIKKYRELEKTWNEPNRCAKLAFGRANRSLTLRRNDTGSETVRVDAQPGGSPQKATWELTNMEFAQVSLAGGTANPTSFDYKVLYAQPNGEVRAKVKAVSKAGVAEDTWIQKTDQDSLNEISGTFSWRTEFFGSVFEAAGNAKFVRSPPCSAAPKGPMKWSRGCTRSPPPGKPRS